MGKLNHYPRGNKLTPAEYEADNAHQVGGYSDSASLKLVRTATYVVAASDAPTHVKAQADWVCDGTADEVEIQAALDAVHAAGGGTVFLVGPGTYEIGASQLGTSGIYAGLVIWSNTKFILERGATLTQATGLNLQVMFSNAADFNVTYGVAWDTNIEIDIEGTIDMNWANQTYSAVDSSSFQACPVAIYYADSCEFSHINAINYGRYGALVLGNVTNSHFGSVVGKVSYDSAGAGYPSGVFITAIGTYNITGDSVIGHNLAGPALYLEDNPDQVIVGKVVAKWDAKPTAGSPNTGSGGLNIALGDASNPVHLMIGEIIAQNCSHGVSIDFQTSVNCMVSIGSIQVENSAYYGIKIVSTGSGALAAEQVQIGQIISLNNGQVDTSGYASGLNIDVYIKGVEIGKVIAYDTQTPKTQYYGVLIGGSPTDSIQILSGDVRSNITAGLSHSNNTNSIFKNILGYVTENSGTATVGGGTLTNGTGIATGSPITLIPGANTPTITQAGTFVINLPAGNVGTAATGGWTVTGSPVALVAGDNTITVVAGGTGTITVTTATVLVTVTHGLAATPTRVNAIPTSDPGAANAFWISAKGATTFVINAKVAVTAQTTFDWRAQVGEG